MWNSPAEFFAMGGLRTIRMVQLWRLRLSALLRASSCPRAP